MTSLRSVLETVGVVSVVVALLFLVRPSLAAALSLPDVTLTLLGAVALIEGFRSIRRRRHVGIDQAELPVPEEAIDTPMPGEDFDRSLRTGRIRETEVRRRLFSAAAESIAVRADVDLAEAERRVEAGEWTDDPIAASYIGGPEAPQPHWRDRFKLMYGQPGRHRYSTERTVAAIAALWEDD